MPNLGKRFPGSVLRGGGRDQHILRVPGGGLRQKRGPRSDPPFRQGRTFQGRGDRPKETTALGKPASRHQPSGRLQPGHDGTRSDRLPPTISALPDLSGNRLLQSGQTGDFARYPNLAKKKKSKQKITRYWIESEDGLLLGSGAKGSSRLAGIYELPENLPVELEDLARKAKHLTTKKRTIGQVDYEEEIHGAALPKRTKVTLPEGYRWVRRTDLDDLTLSGPHRKWIRELQDKPATQAP